MSNPRLAALRALVAKSPGNTAARFGLASELMKVGLWQEAHDHLSAYLADTDDEGNAWGRLAEACVHLGRHEEARAALHSGIEASQRHGHPGMAAELEERLDELRE